MEASDSFTSLWHFTRLYEVRRQNTQTFIFSIVKASDVTIISLPMNGFSADAKELKTWRPVAKGRCPKI
jgi:hypothetical protein